MTKNERIASIMLEAAELLKNDTELDSLNETLNGSTIMGFVCLSALLTVSTAGTISLVKNNIKKNKQNKKLTDLSEYIYIYEEYNSSLINYIKSAKFIKVKEGTIDFLNESVKIIKPQQIKYAKLADDLCQSFNNYKNGILLLSDFISKMREIFSEANKIIANLKKDIYKKEKELIKNNWIDSDKNTIIQLINKAIASDTSNVIYKLDSLYDDIYDKNNLNDSIISALIYSDPDYDRLMNFTDGYNLLSKILFDRIIHDIKIQIKGKKINE